MALLFMDGFDHYATADILTKWNSFTNGGETWTLGAFGRNSTNAMRLTWTGNGAGNVAAFMDRGVVSSGATAILGFAFNPSVASTVARGLIGFYDTTTPQIYLQVNPGNTVSVIRGVSTVLGTTSVILPAGQYTHIELKVLLATGATGTFELRFNGINVLSGSSVITSGSGTLTWNDLHLGAYNGAGTGGIGLAGTWDYDDLYVCDGTGSPNNDFLGSRRVVTRLADAAGTTTQMTATPAVANYLNVDDPTSDGDTTYVAETTVGELDTYNFAALGVTGAVAGVQVNVMARSAGSGGETIAAMVRISTTNYAGATSAGLATTYADKITMYETSPATAAAWTVTEIDGAEFGCKLVS